MPITLLLSGAAAIAFTWATRNGQFDDLDTEHARRRLKSFGFDES